jgi:hypothetical protein
MSELPRNHDGFDRKNVRPEPIDPTTWQPVPNAPDTGYVTNKWYEDRDATAPYKRYGDREDINAKEYFDITDDGKAGKDNPKSGCLYETSDTPSGLDGVTYKYAIVVQDKCNDHKNVQTFEFSIKFGVPAAPTPRKRTTPNPQIPKTRLQ